MAKVLVVDDDADIRDIYKEALEEAGYQVEVAKDGEEGLGKILQGGFDLILLDIMMPKIDGLTILKRLRDKPPPVYNGPIIVISQLNEERIKNTAIELGAQGYLIKSDLTPDQLLNRISKILQDNTHT